MLEGFDCSQRRADDPRRPVHLLATIEPMGTAAPPQPGEIANLSRGGLALRFLGVLDPGAPVRVTLHLPSGGDLTCGGRVAWVDRAFQVHYGAAGVAFKEDLDGDLVTAIARAEFPTSGPPPDASGVVGGA